MICSSWKIKVQRYEVEGIILTAAWLAQLGECQSAEWEFVGLNPWPDQHSES